MWVKFSEMCRSCATSWIHRHRSRQACSPALPRLILLGISCALSGNNLSADAADLTGTVIGIQDGDTLTVLVDRKPLRVRLAEIDAPEKAQPFGARSKESLSGLCFQKSAKVQPVATDRYGRTVAAVSCAGQDAAAHQVSNGMAWVYDRYAAATSPLYVMQDLARSTAAGLWSERTPIPPWKWRRTPSP